ncbi:hypothetical protein EDB89DRAFT_2163037 [Lactarius sanguifluus]|nr:hypothetical protein EDB89DRAFT_2163037 [Lactarius sanguifluus]
MAISTEVEGIKPPTLPFELTAIHDSLFDTLSPSAESANVLISKVISALVDQHAKLDLRRRSSPSLEKSWSTHSVIHPGVSPGCQPSLSTCAAAFFITAAITSLLLAPGQDILASTVFPHASLRANGIPQVRTHFCIKERSYFTVPAIQETLLLTDCFEIIVNLSLLTTDTMSRVIKFLRAFNSRNAFYWFEEASLRNTLPSPHRLSTFHRYLPLKQAVVFVELDRPKHDQ